MSWFNKLLLKLGLSPSIRTKLMAIISAVVLISLLILTYITLTIFEEDMKGMVDLVNSRTTKLLGDKVETEIKQRIHGLNQISKLMRSGAVQEIRNTSMTPESDLLYFMKMTDGGRAYELINSQNLEAKGMTTAEIYKAIAKLSGTAIFRQAIGGQTIVKNVSPLFQRPLWMLAVPESGSALVGFYHANELATVFISDRISQAKGANSIVTSFLVDTAGQIILHPNKDLVIMSKSMQSSPIFTEMIESQSRHGFKRYNTDNGKEIGAYMRLDLANLGVITTVNEDLALEGVYMARVRAILISLLIISFAIIFVFFFAKTMTSPIKTLVAASKEITLGNYKLDLVPQSSDEIGELTTAFGQMAKGLEEREKLKGAFNKFVNEEIANQILAGTLKLGGESKHVSVFFSDIRSFTTISETMKPAEVVEFLNEYMTLMVEIIHRHQGVVDKFIGDAIMAVWGAPVTRKNDAHNSVTAALEMRTAMLKFNANRGTAKKPYIHIGCGINTGEVLAGQIGSENRLEYTVIGDAVNLASRVESLCKSFGVDFLISEGTYQEVKDKFSCVPMGAVKVKGKAKEQKIFAVLGHKGDSKAPGSLTELRKLLNIKVVKKDGKLVANYALVKG